MPLHPTFEVMARHRHSGGAFEFAGRPDLVCTANGFAGYDLCVSRSFIPVRSVESSLQRALVVPPSRTDHSNPFANNEYESRLTALASG